MQIGFPLFGSRYSRFFTSYTLEQKNYETPGATTSRFFCPRCVLSSVGFSVMRDTRINMPLPTGGTLNQIEVSQNGGVLKGSGDFQRVTVEGRWYAPLAQLSGRMRRFRIKVVPGDRVTVGISPYDPQRGIITFRAR